MNSAERKRYSRHLLIPEVGVHGQTRLQAARVLCIGAGGLGSAALSYLAAAGVGRIGIVDDDTVDTSNLQRQILYATSDVGRLKVEAARERLQAINPHCSIDAYPIRCNADNVRDLVRAYDCVLDGSDSFSTRYIVNDACVLESRANIFASIFRFHAQISVFAAAGKPCYRCLYPQRAAAGTVPSCAEGGVLGAIAGIAGTWQAIEVLKQILQIGTPLQSRLLTIDALGAQSQELRLEADPACEICGTHPVRYAVVDDEPSAAPLRHAEEVQPHEFMAAIEAGARLLDVREMHEAALGIFPGSLHIPFSQLDERLSELRLDETYIVACRIGQRSLLAVERLQEAGLRRIKHLQGGLLAVDALTETMYLF